MENTNNAPVTGKLKTDRSVGKFILYTLITFGIYPIVFMSSISSDINIIASGYDGKSTMHYCLIFFLLGPVTFEIATLVWYINLSNRIGAELKRRGIDYSFGAGTFWGWNFFGWLILVGPFVYAHKIATAMNLLAEDSNIKG